VDWPAIPSHTEAFAAFREDRARERAQEVRVTWRRVSTQTGGGWSGLGPDGRLVYVGPASKGEPRLYEYGRRVGDRKAAAGSKTTLEEAKRAAEQIMKKDINDAARAAEGGSMSSTTTILDLTASLAEGLGEVAGSDKGSIRILANGHRLAYVNPRKDSLRLDISARDVEAAPARFQKMMGDVDKRGYRALNVTAKNLKGARALLEWVAKNTAQAA